MPEHIVEQGECLESIAKGSGFDWKTIWNHGGNSALREKRKNPNLLYPGDVVEIPERTKREESGATENRHRFKLKNVPSRIRIRLMRDEEPRADETYTLKIDGEMYKGKTDNDGNIDHPIPPTARSGTLILGDGLETYGLNLGHLDPVEEMEGIQARLNNLGYHCGDVDGVLGPATRNAVARFQYVNKLKVDGIPGPKTQAKLKELHGC